MLSESEMDGLATKKAASPPPTYDGGGERKGVGYYRNWVRGTEPVEQIAANE